jgi:ATP-dependent RNA helicase HelY
VVLRDGDLAAGDFVRRCKQLVDLLGQVGTASEDQGLRRASRQARDGVLRGVVAHALPE